MTLSSAIGALLLALLGVDVLLTVFPPLGHGGPVHRRQNHLVWSLFRLLGRRSDGSVRPTVLGLAGPLIAVMSVAVWGVWLIVGFALVYAPHSTSFYRAAATAPDGWTEALYYSGYVASTLGLGDVVATTPALRLLTIVEAMAGFALFAVATSYVFSITRELATAGTLALELASFRGRGSEVSERARAGEHDDAIARWTEAWARSLLRMAHAHGQYPLLQFFRATDQDRALPVQLGQLLELVSGERDVGGAGAVGGPGARRRGSSRVSPLVRDALLRYLAEVNRACIPASFDPLPGPPGQMPPERLHARLLRYTCYDPPPPT